jgi:DNA-binding response OmpR family regulator
MILIVDDFQDSGEALCRLLSHQGYPCQWVGSGREAVALIRAHPPEQPLLVILDEMMPDLTGTEVLKVLRDDEKTRQTAVLMHSAGFDLEKRDEAMTLGAVAWIMKGGSATGGVDSVLRTIVHWYTKVGGVSSRQSPPLRPTDAPPGAAM